MIETLYRTDAPEKESSECYVLVLASRPGSGGQEYSFMEEHGDWDKEAKRFRYKTIFVHTDGQLNYQAARELYEKERVQLASQGFVHSVMHQSKRHSLAWPRKPLHSL